ncbi:hypothetical protein Rsub_02165 [Raphidocelis subcapitata]|uniref:Uncharacterized protein n=1 Tax=Raphidocelis subcapitata TaxID=307507 RepID=A0A2V0NNW3_9CHLO|nr:hypothetical protein Rsub_02165 [Raphidocelis subcapitata]|eukprot:GBF89288.1 hypothetical protein Rsub_02165 [Raphidocelis subcapitata]
MAALPMRRAAPTAAAAAAALLLLLLPAASAAGPRCAIYNPVHFHLEVVAGAVNVLQQLTTEPVDVYLPEKVVKANWYGFLSWMGEMEDVRLIDSNNYDGVTHYDLVWFISPEFRPPALKMSVAEHVKATGEMIARMQAKVVMLMVHNGHLPEDVFNGVASLATPGVPLLTLAPHVASSIANRTRSPGWLLPTLPFAPAAPCALADVKAGRQCVRGFSVQGRIEKSRRNYTQVWEQIGGHKRHQRTSATASNFKLNILGELVEAFAVPVEVQDMVSVYKNPPYNVFYDVVAHSLGLVPMLASDLYYKSKFSSTVLTSLITGTPIIADQRLLDAYTMLDRSTTYYQAPSQSELDVMFAISKTPADELWRTRDAVVALRERLNSEARAMIKGWLEARGVSTVQGPGARRKAIKRRRLAAAAAEAEAPGLPRRLGGDPAAWGPAAWGRLMLRGGSGGGGSRDAPRPSLR